MILMYFDFSLKFIHKVPIEIEIHLRETFFIVEK